MKEDIYLIQGGVSAIRK